MFSFKPATLCSYQHGIFNSLFRPRYVVPFKGNSQLHDVFHVSLFRNGPDPEGSHVVPALQPDIPQRELKSVLGHRRHEKNLNEYFVYLKGETTDDLRWLPYHQLPQNQNTKKQIRYYTNLR